MAIDLIAKDERSGQDRWSVVAVVDVVASTLVVTKVEVSATLGLEVDRLQESFRWRTPLDVVSQLVPSLMAAGIDPYEVSLPVGDYPESARLGYSARRHLTDEFLEEVARRYLALGRGYASTLARDYGVSPRTVVNWIEKCRARGILTRVPSGSIGGQIVPREDRPDSAAT
ncbi:MAG: hypothetical protein H6525_02595 [Actinobacteria bacterium]|nr:hypothetical protein [Actinomycetota bacterium]MCB9411728.1 hypothetical protein [Actinomycetota bacterium]